MAELDEVDLIRKHYGDFTGLFDQGQAVAHVKVLLAEIDTYDRNIEDLNDRSIRALKAAARERERALAKRLAAAETVCTIFGWTGYGEEGLREKAAVQAYMDWANTYGAPGPDPAWNERVRSLVAKRDAGRVARAGDQP